MIRISKILLGIYLLFLTSCIDFFRPELGEISPKYVVDGYITDQEGFQTIYVSTTSTLEKTKYNPLPYCKVKIIDDQGNIFNTKEDVHGIYTVWMGKEYLVPGRSYKVDVTTASGIEMSSDFEKMPGKTNIDSIYYVRKDFPTSNPNITIQVIQFYVDLSKKDANSQYFKWDVIETWEHHSVYPITWYAEGTKYYFPPNYSLFTCWTTQMVKDIFTLSTEKITGSTYKMKSLQLVDNQTQKLTFGYSALFNQYSISKAAYEFWENARKVCDDQGGLYSSQPVKITGNIKCISDPSLEVLGFFGASTVTSKRIFVRNVENFKVFEPICNPPYLPLPFNEFEYMIEIGGVKYVIDEPCVECNYYDGTTNKPSFWPW